jgi:hypothetical protein
MIQITVQQFLVELRPVLQQVTFELHQRQSGIPGVGTIGELQFIQNELSAVESKAVAGTLPPVGERWLASARVVTDTWPNDSPLGTEICALATKYRRQLA